MRKVIMTWKDEYHQCDEPVEIDDNLKDEEIEKYLKDILDNFNATEIYRYGKEAKTIRTYLCWSDYIERPEGDYENVVDDFVAYKKEKAGEDNTSKIKMSREFFGAFKLISVKEVGCPWEGCLWVKANSLKEWNTLSPLEQTKRTLSGCPLQVPSMCFPADYPYIRSECKKAYNDDFKGKDGNCCFLFSYADRNEYDCRFSIKNAGERIYKR